MTEARPLLPFPAPTVERAGAGTSVPPRVRGPGAGRQGTRLTPQFEVLRQAVEARRAEVGVSANSAIAELVVVFDLAGTVTDFVKACRQVRGFEFLADIADADVEADDDFFVEERGRRAEGSVPQTLYIAMTNAEAVNQFIRLFNLWRANPSAAFPRGLAPLKNVFGLLRSVRRWEPQDRVRETGLLDEWRALVALVGQSVSTTRVEIELWYRKSSQQRAAAERHVRRIVESAGGQVFSRAQIDGINYHALLADLPRQQVERVVATGVDSIDLMTAEDVMFISPAESMSVSMQGPATSTTPDLASASVSGTPTVALLDGLPLAQHVALAGRLVVDDPDDLASRYTDSSSQRHGTAMASLIIHGDLSRPGEPLTRPLYVRPVLEPQAWPRHAPERTPGDLLLVDLIHRAFLRMFESEAGRPPAAPDVRVVNLSIGDRSRVFVRRMSPLARLLDWLAHKHNVVVVVSSGNHPVAPVVAAEVIANPEARASAIASHLHESALHLRLLSPAESINALTVGATGTDESLVELPDTVIDMGGSSGPAPYSAMGGGFRRAVKPEVLAPGGRVVFVRPVESKGEVELRVAEAASVGPGVKVAAPGEAGELDGAAFGIGTSNSAALVTRSLAEILSVLDLHEGKEGWEFLTVKQRPVLAKTLLVHSAAWNESAEDLASRLDLPNSTRRTQLAQLLGYGIVDPRRVATAERVRAVLVHSDLMAATEQHVYRLPIPAALTATTEWRRLTVTLGWLSPVRPQSQRYRGASLSVSTNHEILGLSRAEVEHHASRRGTLQHDVFVSQRAVAPKSTDLLEFRIECKADAGERIDGSGLVRYGFAVTLEVSPSVQIDIHEQVQTALSTRVATRPRVATRSSTI